MTRPLYVVVSLTSRPVAVIPVQPSEQNAVYAVASYVVHASSFADLPVTCEETADGCALWFGGIPLTAFSPTDRATMIAVIICETPHLLRC